jgi:hypothetical protein
VFGSLAGIATHLITRDFHFASFFQQKWTDLKVTERFDGFPAYETELIVFGIGIFAITFIYLLRGGSGRMFALGGRRL